MKRIFLAAVLTLSLAAVSHGESYTRKLVKSNFAVTDTAYGIVVTDTTPLFELLPKWAVGTNRVFRSFHAITTKGFTDSLMAFCQISPDGERWRAFDSTKFKCDTTTAVDTTWSAASSLDLDSTTIQNSAYIRYILKDYKRPLLADSTWLKANKYRELYWNVILQRRTAYNSSTP